VKFSFAASSLLARQIEAGAPADLFVSADGQWMDYLAQRKRIRVDSRRDVATNRLVLVAPVDESVQLRIAPGFALAAALGRGRLATADPDTVPAGRYAKSALTTLGVWTQVEPRLVRADDVRGALALVARGEVPLGIVYETDARIDRRVRVVDVFPENTHPPIAYPAAAISARPEAARLLEFIAGPDGAATFAKFGFGAAAAPAARPTR
jgi:molybdate transport system substrate-binding protein